MSTPEIIDTRSTISAPMHMQSNKSNVPDFTEFKLESFKMNSSSDITPAPHRLREARRSLLLYLEPNPDTPVYNSLQDFQEKTLAQFGPNQAHNTKPHLSIFNRILIKRGSDFATKWQTVNEFIEVVDEEIKRHQLKAPEFSSFEVQDKPTHSLVINVRTNDEYQQFVHAIQERIGEKCSSLEIGPMTDIHLAYNVLNSITNLALKRIKNKAEELIDVNDWVKTGGSWRITLYEVMLESQVVGVQHQINEIRSWPVQTNNSYRFASALPVPLRIKLSYLSSWLKIPSFSFTAKKTVTPSAPPPKDAIVVRKKQARLPGYKTI